MKNLIKKGLLMLGVTAFILPLSNPAYASTSEASLTQESEVSPLTQESEISPLWVYYYDKTITMDYATAASIPPEVHYEYYDEVFGWMRGVMKYQFHNVVKGKYVATFKGTMYSNPL